MGKVFKGTRKAVVANAAVVSKLIEASVILLLHGKAEYADDLIEAMEEVKKALQSDEVTLESQVHELVEKAFQRMLEGKPYHVKAAMMAVLDAVLAMAAEKVTFDLDDWLSAEERKAWVGLVDGVIRAAKVVMENETSGRA